MNLESLRLSQERRKAFFTNPILRKDFEMVNEAVTIDKARSIKENGENFRVYINTDKTVIQNKLKEVYDPIFFKDGKEPTDGGLYSPTIFGSTPRQKRWAHAYIDLGRKFFHPYIFEILCQLNTNFKKVAMGHGSWKIVNGDLVLVGEQDKEFDRDATGITWLISVFHKLKFEDTGSELRAERIKLIKSLTDDEIFISKYIVLPVFYRDIEYKSGRPSVPELSKWYAQIITNVNSYKGDLMDFSRNVTMYNIQNKMVEIRKYGQSLIEKKSGALQKTVLGKVVDYGGRGVISAPSLNYIDKPDECIVDITHTGIPLAYCVSLGYPFIVRWIMNFLEDLFRGKTEIKIYDTKTKTAKMAQLDTNSLIYTKDIVNKKLEMFIRSYGGQRFETINVRTVDGEVYPINFLGSYHTAKLGTGISNRPLTWTDVIYMAAYNTLTDKFCYVTRYPILDYFGTYVSQAAVLSTIQTAPCMVDERMYPHYPVIDLSLPSEQVATKFIDTFSLSNLHLDAMGGDYDGDTVSVKLVYSQEANDEAAELIRQKKNYVNINGKLVKVAGNEVSMCLYNMTRRE